MNVLIIAAVVAGVAGLALLHDKSDLDFRARERNAVLNRQGSH
ncbi:hypothetical protein [Skermania sp. ID1734]|nr:hypothetical protein [Skermania sp. ID1734]